MVIVGSIVIGTFVHIIIGRGILRVIVSYCCSYYIYRNLNL